MKRLAELCCTTEKTEGKSLPASVDALCGWVRRKKLEAPALFLLEVHRPLMPLAWPAVVMAGPFIAPFVGPDFYSRIEALKDPALLDRVLQRLELPDGAAGKPADGKDVAQ